MTLSWPTTDPERCAICGHDASEAHHLLHRSQGGSDDDHNLLLLCRPCHDSIHRRGYRVERTRSLLGDQQGTPITITSLTLWSREGELILARHHNSGFNQSAHLAELQAMPNLLEYCIEEVKYLDEEGMAEAAQIVGRDLGEKGWKYLAELMRRARLMLPWGDRTEKLTAIAEKCGMSWRTAQRLALIAERIDLPTLSASRVDDMSMVLVAAESQDPVAALAHIEERKAENPNYSVNQARRELATQEAVEGGKSLARALTLLQTAYALTREASELIGALDASLEADQIAEVAHNIYELVWQIGDRASPSAKEE